MLYSRALFLFILFIIVCIYWTSLVAQMVKCLSTMQETWVPSLGQEDPLEKEMATHSSTIAGKIPWTEEPDKLQSMGSQRVRHNWATSLSLHLLIPSSHSILPTPPPSLATQVYLYVCESFFVLLVSSCHILDSIYKCYHMIFVFLLPTLLHFIR